MTSGAGTECARALLGRRRRRPVRAPGPALAHQLRRGPPRPPSHLAGGSSSTARGSKGDRAGSAAQTLKNVELFGAPHVAIITTEAVLGTYGAVDCGLFPSRSCWPLHSRGLGAVAQAALAGQAPVLREALGLPEHRLVVAGVSFGCPDLTAPENAFRTERQALADLVTHVDVRGHRARRPSPAERSVTATRASGLLWAAYKGP